MPFYRLSKLLIVCSIVLFLMVSLVVNRPLDAQEPVEPTDHISAHLLALAAPSVAADHLESTAVTTPPEDLFIFDAAAKRIAVRITAEDVTQLIPLLETREFEVLSSMPNLHFVEGYLPLDQINHLAELVPAGLLGAMPMYRPLTNAGDVTTEGDIIHEAARVRAMPEMYSGSGITIGVLSDSYNNLGGAAADVTSGDLPNDVLVIADAPSGQTDEGRAMLQVVHDLAPDASLAFATAATGQGAFANNIRALAAAGADVIVDNQVYIEEPFFQDGPIGIAISEVVNHDGVLYFAAAGNLSNQAYESTVFSTITDTITDTGSGAIEIAAYDFDPSPVLTDTRQRIAIGAGEQIRLSFQWDDPFFQLGAVDTDLDIYLVDESGDIVASAKEKSILNNTPLEILAYTNPNASFQFYDLVIALADGTPPGRIKYINFGNELFVDEFDTNSPTVIPHAAAPGAQAVGAVFYPDHSFPRAFTAHGPSTFLFDGDGNPFPQPDVRLTPHFAAVDGINNTFYGADVDSDGFPNFGGTSAAAAHAAGIGALVRQANPTAMPDEIYALMANSAIDIIGGGATVGHDNITGAGLLNAFDAIYPIQPRGVNLVFSDDFETGGLSDAWETVSRDASRLQVTTENIPSSGSYHVTMDIFGGFATSLNEMILHLNLQGGSNVILTFDQKEFFDIDDPMPSTFTGSTNADGVAFSVDGGETWYRLMSLIGSNSIDSYQTQVIDLSAAATNEGVTLGEDVRIKFQQYDSNAIDNAGMAFDNIEVTSATPAGVSEIVVLDGVTEIVDGVDTVDFGGTEIGTPVNKIFTVNNTGPITLTLDNLSVPAGFEIINDFGVLEVPAAGLTSFEVALSASAVGSYSGTVSFENNDEDENPFNFEVTGVVTTSLFPEIAVAADGVNLEVGDSVDFGGTIVGNPLTRTFTVSNTGTSTLTLANLNTPVGFAVASDFGVTEVPTDTATTFVISLTADLVGTYSGTLTFTHNDNDENPFEIVLIASVTAGPEPEIQVATDGENVPNGGSVDLGTVVSGDPLTKTFVVRNSGTSTLTLSNLSVPAGLEIASSFGVTEVVTGTETTFAISLTATAAGEYSGTLSFENDDGDENPYEIRLTAEVLPPPMPEISVTAGITEILNGGRYDIGVTTIGTPLTQSFTISNSGTTTLTLANLTVPAGFTITEAFTDHIGVGMTTTFGVALEAADVGTITGTVRFENNDDDENPFAFEISGDVLGLPEIAVTTAGVTVPNGTGSFDYGNTFIGQPLTQTFTISNVGTASLTLANLTVPAGFSVTMPFSSTVEQGLTTTMDIVLEAMAIGTFSGTVSFETNDADENPYEFFVMGNVTAAPTPEIEVSVDGVEVPNMIGHVEFGSTVISDTVTKTIHILNSGTATLTVSNLTIPAGFTTTAPLSATVPPAAEMAVTMTLEAAAAGVFSGTVHFDTNDEDENPYVFDIEGTVNISPETEIQVVDGFINIRDGESLIDFGTTPFGVNVTKTLLVKNVGLEDLLIGSVSVPGSYTAVFSDTLIKPGESTPLVMTLIADTAGVVDGTFAFDNNDSNESRFTIQLTAFVEEELLPEIEVYDGLRLLVDDVSTVNFGLASLGHPAVKTFVVSNTGAGSLNLSNLDVIGSGFSIASDFMTTTVASGQFTTFTIQLDSAAVGTYAGVVTFDNNDETENPFRFIIEGAVDLRLYLPLVIQQ